MKLLKLVPDHTNIDFMRWRNLALVLSLIATATSIAFTVYRGLNLGIDFVGGEVVRVEQYFHRFPELGDDPNMLLDLIVAEFEVRSRRESPILFAEYCQRFPDLRVVFWPFDFSWAVRRAIRAVNPTMVVLAESELWPNFLRAARKRKVPVVVVNARMSPRSFRRLKRMAGLARRVLFDVGDAKRLARPRIVNLDARSFAAAARGIHELGRARPGLGQERDAERFAARLQQRTGFFLRNFGTPILETARV